MLLVLRQPRRASCVPAEAPPQPCRALLAPLLLLWLAPSRAAHCVATPPQPRCGHPPSLLIAQRPCQALPAPLQLVLRLRRPRLAADAPPQLPAPLLLGLQAAFPIPDD